jgi:membrane associated rhomboid family serine protease
MITLIIVISTALVSIISFRNYSLFRKLSFIPYEILRNKDYFRFLSHAFIHADWIHLIINMLVFYSFGTYVESIFGQMENQGLVFSGPVAFLALYFGGVIAASVTTFFRHRDNPEYISVGASGAVSAVLFTSIFFSPTQKVLFYGILPLPGYVFGILYLVYSSYMSRSSRDNINHDAHLWGAVFGFIMPILIEPELFIRFINQF